MSIFRKKNRYIPATNGILHVQRQSAISPLLPRIDTSRTTSPVLVRDGDSAKIAIEVRGFPPPVVRWYIGDMRVTPSVEYQVKENGHLHTLFIACATEELEDGVFITASNASGMDKKKVDVKLYRVLTRHKSEILRERANRHKSTETLPSDRRTKVPLQQRYKSLGSFSQIETCIDDPYIEPEESVARYIEDIRKQQKYIQSSPDIRQLVANGTPRQSPHLGNHHLSQTLPAHNGNRSSTSSSLYSRHHSSTEDVFRELNSPCIPPVKMDYSGFGPHRSSGSGRIPSSPLLDNRSPNVSVSEQESFYDRYQRTNSGLSSFFSADQPPASRSSAISQTGSEVSGNSFQKDDPDEGEIDPWDIGNTRLSSFVKQTLKDYSPEAVRVRSPETDTSQSFSQTSFKNSDVENVQLTNPQDNSFTIFQSESVLAGNLSQKKPPLAPKPKNPKVKTKKKKVPTATLR